MNRIGKQWYFPPASHAVPESISIAVDRVAPNAGWYIAFLALASHRSLIHAKLQPRSIALFRSAW